MQGGTLEARRHASDKVGTREVWRHVRVSRRHERSNEAHERGKEGTRETQGGMREMQVGSREARRCMRDKGGTREARSTQEN